MTFKSSEDNGVLLLKIEGNLIGEEVGSGLLDSANDAINNGTALCAIDIGAVKYINSSGIGVLITLLTKFRNQEGEVVIVNPSEHVKKLLIITKLTAIFKIADTVEQAIQELKS
jgi:anti-sigma B factor antagonist